jgi:hypothetical protein
VWNNPLEPDGLEGLAVFATELERTSTPPSSALRTRGPRRPSSQQPDGAEIVTVIDAAAVCYERQLREEHDRVSWACCFSKE